MHKYDRANQTVPSPANASPAVTCAVVGARGYSGLELVRWLLGHPFVEVTEAYASKTFALTSEIENPKAGTIRVAGENEVAGTSVSVVFLATPPEVSLELAPKLVASGKKVIDLSGAFRLKKHAVSDWYPFNVAPELLARAHYGLMPFSGPVPATDGGWVSNPGCYATAVQMALIPLLREGLIDPGLVVVDAKSGTSGAGRKAQEGLLFSEVSENLRPYRVGRHQHQPEILEGLSMFGGTAVDLLFTTQLLPVRHGIQAAIYARTLSDDPADFDRAYAKTFAGYGLAKWGRVQDRPELAELSRAVGTPETRISFEVGQGKLCLFSCIDNRLKGAATQAIENLNAWMDWPLATGLGKEQT